MSSAPGFRLLHKTVIPKRDNEPKDSSVSPPTNTPKTEKTGDCITTMDRINSALGLLSKAKKFK